MIKLNIHLWFYDYFTAFCAVKKGLSMIELQDIVKTKRELLGRATYSRNPIIIVQVWQRIRKSGTYNTLPNRIRI